MCGICGIFNYSKQVDRSVLQRMTDRLIHRGPDFQDIYTYNNCGLGHTRLSIIDLSPSGHQPMSDRDKRFYIVFNGEIYNFQALRDNLKKQGVQFKSKTDTEIILYLYKKYGISCLQQLSGMFALAIWDKWEQSLFLARDRMGKKPLFYACLNDCFIFASELNALMTHPSISKEIDPVSLDLYLNLQYIPAPYSIYKNVKKLPAAHYMHISNKNHKIKSYWTLTYPENKKISLQEAESCLLEKIRHAVQKRLISDVPLGALLSGGVDSSLITAMMCQISSKKVKTFSIGFNEADYDELSYARKVAKFLDTDHHEDIVKPDIEACLPEIIHQYGEPFADKSAIPSFAVSKMARQHVTVVLNGDGGDELLAGYWRYEKLLFNSLMDNLLKYRPPGKTEILKAENCVSALSLLQRMKRKYMLSFKHPELQEILGSTFWIHSYRQQLWNKDYQTVMSETLNWKQRLLEQASYATSNRVNRMLWLLNHTYLPYDLLIKMDIASMAYGLEARSPLLDHELVEFCAALPAKYKVINNQGKFLLKSLASKIVPKEVIYRPKQGFSVPISAWLKGDLKSFMLTVLNDKNKLLEQYFKIDTIHKVVSEHLAGQVDHGFRIWALIVFCVWHEQIVRT
jgi:asparagine synthase (glutamine-hydrolysing)